jgi:hypothetical protein
MGGGGEERLNVKIKVKNGFTSFISGTDEVKLKIKSFFRL